MSPKQKKDLNHDKKSHNAASEISVYPKIIFLSRKKLIKGIMRALIAIAIFPLIALVFSNIGAIPIRNFFAISIFFSIFMIPILLFFILNLIFKHKDYLAIFQNKFVLHTLWKVETYKFSDILDIDVGKPAYRALIPFSMRAFLSKSEKSLHIYLNFDGKVNGLEFLVEHIKIIYDRYEKPLEEVADIFKDSLENYRKSPEGIKEKKLQVKQTNQETSKKSSGLKYIYIFILSIVIIQIFVRTLSFVIDRIIP